MNQTTKYLKLKITKSTPCLNDLREIFTNYQYVEIRYFNEILSKTKTRKCILITFNNKQDAHIAYKQLQLTTVKQTKLFFQFTCCNEMDVIWDINAMTTLQTNKILFLNMLKKSLASYWRKSSFIIGITGPSGCGKSTLCRSLCSFLKFHFSNENINPVMIHSDSYFATKHCYLDPEMRLRNMECKEACDYDSMLNDIKSCHSNIILIEGLMIINSLEIMNQCDILILVDCDDNICFERRKSRRKRNVKVFTTYYNRYVFPFYVKNYDYFWTNIIYKLNNNQLFINVNASNRSAYEVLLYL
eukprot:112146_1